MTRKKHQHPHVGRVSDPDTPGSIPRTLDPDLAQDTDDIEAELRQHADESHEPPSDEPRDDDIRQAAETLPSDVPADRADHTDEREERPPRPPALDEELDEALDENDEKVNENPGSPRANAPAAD